jgi:hypothetical protein
VESVPLHEPDRAPMSSLVSQGSKYFEIFRRWVSPVETVLGESCASERRIEPSTVFLNGRYQHDSARGSGRLEIACPNSGSGLFCAHFAPELTESGPYFRTLVCCRGTLLRPVSGICRNTSSSAPGPTLTAADMWDIDCTGFPPASSS